MLQRRTAMVALLPRSDRGWADCQGRAPSLAVTEEKQKIKGGLPCSAPRLLDGN